MDISQSEQDSNLSSADVKQNDETEMESIIEIEMSNKPATTECKDLNSTEYVQGAIEDREYSLIENIEVLNEVPQATGNDKNSDEHGSVHKDGNDLAESENFKTVQKETIEILNVELVTPGRDDVVKSIISKTDISEVNVSGNGSLSSSDTDTLENIEHKKVQNEIDIAETKMDTIDINVIPIMAENQQLDNYSGNIEKYSEIVENVQNEIEGTKIGATKVNVIPVMSENQQLDNYSENIEKYSEIVENVQNEIEGKNIGATEVNVVPATADYQVLPNGSKNMQKQTEPAKSIGLSLLAQYDSADDSDSVEEIPLTAAQDYRNQVFEINSNTDSDDSSSSSDIEYLNELRKTIEKHIEIADDDDREDEDQDDCTDKRRRKQKIKVKGELLLEDLPPIQDLQITVPEDDCIEFGKIHSIVDQLVLVSALPNSILLDLGTVIFLEKGQKVLGEVFDVLGQVADPLYCVRFNSNKQIKEKEIKIGNIVYVAPKTQYTQYVILSNIMNMKGSDASWEHDVEPPPRFLDYSDDEQELLARKQQRNRSRPSDNEDAGKRPRTAHNDDSMPTSSSCHTNSQYRNGYEQRNDRGSPAGQSNIRPRYNGPHQFQHHTPNHYRNSWHSNYNPQSFSTPPPSNFRMQLPQNRAQSPPAYHSNMPAYGMPDSHNLPYSSPSQPPSYGVPPPMFHQQSQQPMPSTLNIRPPIIHGPPHAPYHHQYTSNPPPPPGC